MIICLRRRIGILQSNNLIVEEILKKRVTIWMIRERIEMKRNYVKTLSNYSKIVQELSQTWSFSIERLECFIHNSNNFKNLSEIIE